MPRGLPCWLPSSPWQAVTGEEEVSLRRGDCRSAFSHSHDQAADCLSPNDRLYATSIVGVEGNESLSSERSPDGSIDQEADDGKEAQRPVKLGWRLFVLGRRLLLLLICCETWELVLTSFLGR